MSVTGFPQLSFPDLIGGFHAGHVLAFPPDFLNPEELGLLELPPLVIGRVAPKGRLLGKAGPSLP